jgi:hypothetical protein
MKNSPETITIDNETYVKSNLQPQTVDGMKYVIVRTDTAGVHAGYLKEKNGKEVVLIKSRRIWYWDGAASLSQLAMEGTSEPANCKFPCEINEITLTEAIEIMPTTLKAHKSISEVPVWKK